MPSRDLTVNGGQAPSPRRDEDPAAHGVSAELRTRLGDSFAYGTWLCDAAGQTQHLSQSFLDLLDMTMEEAAGLGWTSRLAPEDLDPMLHAWQATVQQGTAWSR